MAGKETVIITTTAPTNIKFNQPLPTRQIGHIQLHKSIVLQMNTSDWLNVVKPHHISFRFHTPIDVSHKKLTLKYYFQSMYKAFKYLKFLVLYILYRDIQHYTTLY